jgi:hypothetical protein
MALYGGSRDVSLFRHINRELVNNIIDQEVAYYKVILGDTDTNIYGESSEKFYEEPFLLNSIITRGDQEYKETEFGADVDRTMTFAFLKDDLKVYEVVPESGDIVLWHNKFFEIDSVVENQFVVGKREDYSYTEHLSDFGSSLSIICSAHLTRGDRVGIKRERL